MKQMSALGRRRRIGIAVTSTGVLRMVGLLNVEAVSRLSPLVYLSPRPTLEKSVVPRLELLLLSPRAQQKYCSNRSTWRRPALELDLEALKHSDLPTPELRKRLLGLKGVGDYAAANLLMILGRYDAIPVDSWALKMVSNEWYGGAPVGRAEVEAAFEGWGEWKGLAYWLWDWTPVNR